MIIQTRITRESLPFLESGDHLTRSEFERRYARMPEIKKAELIEGVVYMGSPVRVTAHATPHALIMTWLGAYWAETPGIGLADNATVRLDLTNEPQPDALLRIEGGSSQITGDDYIEGAPELIVEIAASSASYDLRQKLSVYRRNRVQEYIVWQIYEQKLDWFCWQSEEYMSLISDVDGYYKSQVFPGLWLDPLALMRASPAEVLQGLRQGLQDPVHAQFVSQLSQRVAR